MLPKALKELLLDSHTHTGHHCHIWRERGGEERLGRIDGGERWRGEVARRDGGERWGGEMGERGGEERERKRGGERGRVVILLIKEVCEGQ